MKINKKSIFYDLKTTLHFLDGLIFGNSLKIIVKKTPNEYKELIVGFHPRKNLYVINKRILKRSQEKVLQRRKNDFMDKIMFHSNGHNSERTNLPKFKELPDISYQFMIAAFVAHEMRHRFQFSKKPNLFRFLLDYQTLDEFIPLSNIMHNILADYMKMGYYSADQYDVEFDAMMVSEIFIQQIYLHQLNGFSFEEATQKALPVITMNSKQLAKTQNMFSFLGKSYFKRLGKKKK
jgi:hypothetical protein